MKKKRKSFKAYLKEYKKHIALVIMGIIIALSFHQCEKSKDKQNSLNDPQKNNFETNQEVKSFDEIINEFHYKFPGLIERYIYMINLSNYTGSSLIDALKENGYQSSFEFRKILAENLGIIDYTGTPEQDEYILNTIRDKDKTTDDEIVEETVTTKPSNQNSNTHKSGNHNFSDWVSINEYMEQRICKCGAVETRNHKYGQSNVKYVSLQNGMHNIITTKTCVNCNYVNEYKVMTNCDFGNWSYDKATGKDVRSCKLCHYKETRDHIHNFNNIIKYDESFEYVECACGETEKIAHQFDKGITNSNGTTTYKCIHQGCGYEKVVEKGSSFNPSHTHDMKLVKWDESYEYYECSCGETKKTSHKFGDKITKDDGSMVYECTNTGCDYEKPHIHVTREDIVPIKSKDVCYEIVVSCKDDDCGELYVTEVDHDYVLLRESVRNEVYGCTVCGREKSVPKKKPDPVEPDPTPVEPDPVTPDPDPVNPEPDKPEEKDPIQSETETVGYVYTLRPINKR